MQTLEKNQGAPRSTCTRIRLLKEQIWCKSIHIHDVAGKLFLFVGKNTSVINVTNAEQGYRLIHTGLHKCIIDHIQYGIPEGLDSWTAVCPFSYSTGHLHLLGLYTVFLR